MLFNYFFDNRKSLPNQKAKAAYYAAFSSVEYYLIIYTVAEICYLDSCLFFLASAFFPGFLLFKLLKLFVFCRLLPPAGILSHSLQGDD